MNNPEFVCPFCKEDCICSRCNRNEHIDKLRTLFVTLGGEIENINYKSYLEKFLLQRDEIFEEIIKKKYAVRKFCYEFFSNQSKIRKWQRQ